MSKNIKDEIKSYYGGIAQKVTQKSKETSCCNTSCCGDSSRTKPLYSTDFTKDLPKEALDASLGCANPIVLANLQIGETVLDLGSGGGIDVLIIQNTLAKPGKFMDLI